MSQTREMRPGQFAVGQSVEVRDANSEWLPAVAVSDAESTHTWDHVNGRWRRIHDFPVVWVLSDNAVGWDPIPWPLEDVRAHAFRPAVSS